MEEMTDDYSFTNRDWHEWDHGSHDHHDDRRHDDEDDDRCYGFPVKSPGNKYMEELTDDDRTTIRHWHEFPHVPDDHYDDRRYDDEDDDWRYAGSLIFTSANKLRGNLKEEKV